MSLAATVQTMADSGCSAEQIARVVAASEAERVSELEAKRERRRAGNAERQRQKRARDKESNACHAVTERDMPLHAVTERDQGRADAPADLELTSLNSKQEPKERTPPKGGVPKKGYRETGTALPEDWHPSDDLLAYGKRLGLTDVQSRDILENMRLWARANRNRSIARKADWDQTAQGFLRRDAAKFQARAGPAIPPQNDRRVYLGVDQQKQLLDEYYDRIEGKNREPAFKLIG